MEQNSEITWEVLMEVYNQDEASLICGLLNMANIPVKMEHEPAGNLYGLTVGLLARIKILVPLGRVPEAEKILAGDLDEPEPLNDEE